VIQEVNADTIAMLDDGRVGLMINEALSRIFTDIEDRSHDGKVRSLQIQLDFIKDHGNLMIEAKVQDKLPAYHSNRTVSRLKGRAGAKGPEYVALFQEHDAENPDQESLYDGDNKETP